MTEADRTVSHITKQAKRKKRFLNNTASEFSSSSSSGSSYEWSNDEDFAINMVKAKKCWSIQSFPNGPY
ncbi:4862_t:CDS:2 [Cetraspora pellucida]|uniref:4862_t:CDS:1 n=1 Tax=Cetraspora pellucida TaxID=1433469 RepID=A0A9N9AXC9_9GLOM|nr:4862_t:CDS:2 [Cetraspora pellucida]